MTAAAGVALLRWRRWGYARDDGYVYVRKGLLGIDRYCVPLFKVQQTKFRQSRLMARQGLCSVRLVLAAGVVDIPFIPAHEGLALVNQTLYDVESSGRSWM